MNGDILSDINIDMEIKKNILKIAENANGKPATNDVPKHHVEIKEVPAASTSAATADTKNELTKPNENTTKPIVTEGDEPSDAKNGKESGDEAAKDDDEDLKVDDIDMGLKDHELLGEESKTTETANLPEKDVTSGVKIEEVTTTKNETNVSETPALVEEPAEGDVILPSINIENVDNIDATIASQLVHEPIVAKALDEVAKIIDGEMKGDVSLNEGDKLEDIGKIVSNDPILSAAQIKTDDKLDDLQNTVKNDATDKLENIEKSKPIAEVTVTPAEKHSREADDEDDLLDESDSVRNAKKIKLTEDGEEKKTNTSILDEPIPQDILTEAVEVAEEVEAAKARDLAVVKESTLEQDKPSVLSNEPAVSDETKPADVETTKASEATTVSKAQEDEPVKSEQLPATEKLVENVTATDEVDNVATKPESIVTNIPTEAVVEHKPVEHIIPVVLESDVKPVEEKIDITPNEPSVETTSNDNQMTDGTIETSEAVKAESMTVEETDATAAVAEDAMEEGPVKDEEQMDVDESNSVDPMDL